MPIEELDGLVFLRAAMIWLATMPAITITRSHTTHDGRTGPSIGTA